MLHALILLASVPTLSGRPESWLWWKPPTTLTKIDRLGRSVEQVLHMGFVKWADVVYPTRERTTQWDGSLAYAVDGAFIVWAGCLRSRNNRLLAHLPHAQQAVFRSLRRHFFRFGMACIALEDEFSSGGTFAIHEPKYMWGKEEETIYALLKHQPAPSLPVDADRRLRERLEQYGSARALSNRIMWGGPPKLGAVHQLAHLATTEHDAIRALVRPLGNRARNNASAFETDYLFD